MGIGLMLGPVLGEIFYKKLGYEYTFLCFSLILAIGGFVVFILLPKELNHLKIGNENKRSKSEISVKI